MTETAAAERNREIAWGVAVVAVLVTVRIVLLVVREPFYDELFTTWLVRRSYGGILEALRHDSGPPLYYFLLKVTGAHSVTSARIFSLVCAAISALVLLRARKLGRARFAVVLLVAFHAPSLLLSVDARAYALCSLFVTIGIVAIVYERPFLAACSFVLAGYSHYYGVLFFATLPRVRAAALAVALFIPGFLLASTQPVEAMQWLLSSLHNPLVNLSFAGLYPQALFKPAAWPLVGIALLVLAATVARDWRMARFALIPTALALLSGLFGRPIYFPMRFEAVIGVPIALWIAQSVERWGARMRILLVLSLVLIGGVVCVGGIIDHAERPLDDYRIAAIAARRNIAPSNPVVASGYLYLESVSALGDRVMAFPAEQAEHPGWRAVLPAMRLREAARTLPLTQFIWIGERGAPELPILCERFTCKSLFVNSHAVIVEMTASANLRQPARR